MRRSIDHGSSLAPGFHAVRNPWRVWRTEFGKIAEKISKNQAYLVSQRILMRRSTDSNSGSPVKTVASSRWAVATQNASA